MSKTIRNLMDQIDEITDDLLGEIYKIDNMKMDGMQSELLRELQDRIRSAHKFAEGLVSLILEAINFRSEEQLKEAADREAKK